MKDIYIAGISRHHDSSICLLKNGEVIFHSEEDRFSRGKHDFFPTLCIEKMFEYTDKVDELVIGGYHKILPADTTLEIDVFSALVTKRQNLIRPRIIDFTDKHHLSHAACAFYNSGFKNAVCVITDGSGSEASNGHVELESIFYIEYPFKAKLLHQKTSINNGVSSGWKFQAICRYLGFDYLDAGKVMGLSSYGKENDLIPNLDNDFLFEEGARIKEELFHPLKFNDTFQNRADLAYKLQKVTQEKNLRLVNNAIKLSGCKNVCFSGGYALNCVANEFIINNLPSDINFYVEPISGDAGTSIGAAKIRWHMKTLDTTIRPQTNIYYGLHPKYTLKLTDKETKRKVTKEEIVDLIIDGNIVALYSGRAESGPRALGNRSILFDPRIKNGKDIVNTVKKREEFRPFAGSILEEKVHEWFNMGNIDKSPFMMYAVKVKEDKKELIPSIVHVDGTCRIQTVSKKQNKNFRELIEIFYEKTGVPILFNTSFNLAGDPLVDSVDDALETLRNSDINYVYFADIETLVEKVK